MAVAVAAVAVIAAVMVAEPRPLSTMNPRDFELLSDLETVALHHPDTTTA